MSKRITKDKARRILARVLSNLYHHYGLERHKLAEISGLTVESVARLITEDLEGRK